MQPFVIPAMGSHGGASADGQRDVLVGYGITREVVGMPIISSMDVRQIGAVDDLPVFMSTTALEADYLLLVNRVKPHTGFTGEIGSGLLKMMTIGMGKHRGAVQAHRANIRLGYERMMIQVNIGT